MRKRMDWRSVKFDWNCARAFLVTAEEGSLSAAARALGMAQPTLSRQVAALEHELRVPLFERVGRGLVLTDTGLSLLEHVRAMGDAAQRVALSAGGQPEIVSGRVCIAATQLVAAYVLPAFIARLRQKHPSIDLKLLVSDEPGDWRRSEAELALASESITESPWTAQRLRDLELGLYAAPLFVKQRAVLRGVSELGDAQLLGVGHDAGLLSALKACGLRGAPTSLTIQTENCLLAWELVKQGLGIGLAPEGVGEADATVERLLPELTVAVPCWLLSQSASQRSASARVVLGLLTAELG